MITKSELEIIDYSKNGFNVLEKAFFILGNILIGITTENLLLNKNIADLSPSMAIIFAVGIILNILGFFSQNKKDKNINRILKKYSEDDANGDKNE
jgi:hypothetical protein